MFGYVPHTIEGQNHTCYKQNYGVSADYVYICDNGFSLGFNFSYYGSNIQDKSSLYNVPVISDFKGNGFSIAPNFGWSFKGKSSLVQILLNPFVIENLTYNTIVYTAYPAIGPQYLGTDFKKVEYNSFKSGLNASLEWGWEHFKLGLGAGIYGVILDSYNGEMAPCLGVDVSLIEKITFLF